MTNKLFAPLGLAALCAPRYRPRRCDRPYRAAMTHEAAVAELLRTRGSELDEACVDALIASQEVRHQHAA